MRVAAQTGRSIPYCSVLQVRVEQFPVASQLINELMTLLRDHVKAVPTLRTKLFQVGTAGV